MRRAAGRDERSAMNKDIDEKKIDLSISLCVHTEGEGGTQRSPLPSQTKKSLDNSRQICKQSYDIMCYMYMYVVFSASWSLLCTVYMYVYARPYTCTYSIIIIPEESSTIPSSPKQNPVYMYHPVTCTCTHHTLYYIHNMYIVHEYRYMYMCLLHCISTFPSTFIQLTYYTCTCMYTDLHVQCTCNSHHISVSLFTYTVHVHGVHVQSLHVHISLFP